MSARASLILSALLASSAAAAPNIDPQFGSHAVIQRGRPVAAERNDARPASGVTVSFAGQTQAAKADANGRWHAAFPARAAGGPQAERQRSRRQRDSTDDVVIGDVWLCSGQSNMEYPLRRALNGDGEVRAAERPDLRLMKVPQQLADSPGRHLCQGSRVATLARRTARATSPPPAISWSRDLRKTEKVPIGAIDDSWGGTPIRAWMGEAAGAVERQRRCRPTCSISIAATTTHRRSGGSAIEWGAWWRSKTGDDAGAEPWHASDRLTWKPVPSLDLLGQLGPEWKAWIGAAWVRERVTLTAAEAAQTATLSLSAIDDMDQTFVNGIAVGGKNDPANPRSYPVPRAC